MTSDGYLLALTTLVKRSLEEETSAVLRKVDSTNKQKLRIGLIMRCEQMS